MILRSRLSPKKTYAMFGCVELGITNSDFDGIWVNRANACEGHARRGVYVWSCNRVDDIEENDEIGGEVDSTETR